MENYNETLIEDNIATYSMYKVGIDKRGNQDYKYIDKFIYDNLINRAHPFMLNTKVGDLKDKNIFNIRSKIKSISYTKNTLDEIHSSILDDSVILKEYDKYEEIAFCILNKVRYCLKEIFLYESESQTFYYIMKLLLREDFIKALLKHAPSYIHFFKLCETDPSILNYNITYYDLLIYSNIIDKIDRTKIHTLTRDFEYLSKRKIRIAKLEEYLDQCRQNKYLYKRCITKETIKEYKRKYFNISDPDIIYILLNFLYKYINKLEKLDEISYAFFIRDQSSIYTRSLFEDNKIDYADAYFYYKIFYKPNKKPRTIPNETGFISE